MMVAGSIKKEKIMLNERIKQVPKLTLKFEENSPEKNCLQENLKKEQEKHLRREKGPEDPEMGRSYHVKELKDVFSF